MQRRKLFSLGVLVAAVAGTVGRSAIDATFARLAEAVFKDDFAHGLGEFMTFSVADVLIVALFALGVAGLFWPQLSRFLQSDIERKSLESPTVKRRVFVDCQFDDHISALFLSDARKPYFVDCTFTIPHLGIADCLFLDGFRAEFPKVSICTAEELDDIKDRVPVVSRAVFANSPIYTDHLYALQSDLTNIKGGQAVKNVVPIDYEAIRRPYLLERIFPLGRRKK